MALRAPHPVTSLLLFELLRRTSPVSLNLTLSGTHRPSWAHFAHICLSQTANSLPPLSLVRAGQMLRQESRWNTHRYVTPGLHWGRGAGSPRGLLCRVGLDLRGHLPRSLAPPSVEGTPGGTAMASSPREEQAQLFTWLT